MAAPGQQVAHLGRAMDPFAVLLVAALRRGMMDAQRGDCAAAAWLRGRGAELAAAGLGADITPRLEGLRAMAQQDSTATEYIPLPADAPRELRAAVLFVIAELPGLLRGPGQWRLTLTCEGNGAPVAGQVARGAKLTPGR